ncbi:MAG: hypothetical protein IJU21_06980 [Bacteroidales bacterium]|nr:hypothetical protein [Bacteroidales bacterium]
MKQKIFLLAALPCILLASCAKETLSPENNSPEKVFTLEASAPRDIVATTKTSMVEDGIDNYAVTWSAGDAIKVNGNASTGITVNPSNAKKATFEFSSEIEAPFKSVYPSSVYKSESVITIPATQTFASGTFDPAAAIMAGYSTSNGIVFQHMMSYLLFTFDSKDNAKIKSIQVKPNGTTPMSGDFNITYTPSVGITPAATDGADVTLNCGAGAAPTSEFVIAIPAGTYTGGFKMIVTDVNDYVKTLNSAATFTGAPGKIYRQRDINSSEIGIWSESDFSAFLAAVNAGDYSEWCGPDGDVDLFVDLSFDSNVYSEGTFDGTFDGHDHTITITGKTRPIFRTIAAGGEVKNLTIGGTATGCTDSGLEFWASFARVNLGTIQDCVNETTCDIIWGSTGGIGFGGFVGQNGGLMENCTNNGDINLTVQTNTIACFGGGLAAFAHTVEDGDTKDKTGLVAGKFLNCTNTGNIIVNVTSGAALTKAAFGGICGVSMLNGVEFEVCANTANVHRIDNGAANNVGACCVGGILGRSARWSPSGAYWLDMDGNYGFYDTKFTDCSNTGEIVNSVYNEHNFKSQKNGSEYDETGNKKDYSGGIVGAIAGRKASSVLPQLIRCSNTGTVMGGYNTVNNPHVVGGLIGGARYVTLTDCQVDCTVKSYNSTLIGPVGGFVGYSLSDVTITGGKCKAKVYTQKGSVSYYSYGLVVGCTRTANNPVISGVAVGGSCEVTGGSGDKGVNSTNFLNFICVNDHWSDRKPSVSSCTWTD